MTGAVLTAVPRSSAEIDEIDGLRGIAILAVMVHRLWPRDAVNRFSVAADAGWIGVDLFFVVSGFLITRILLETRNDPDYFRNFYARRVLRIFPLYYLFVGTLLVVFPLMGNSSYLETSGSPFWYLTFLGNIPESLLGKDPPYWLAPVWSLAIEEQFYLTFPWLVYWLGPQRLGRLLVGLFLLAPVVRLGTMLVWPEQERIQYLFTLCRVDAIAAGCMIALIMRWKHVRATRGLAILIACCAGAVAVLGDLDRTTTFGRVAGYSFVAIGCAALLLAVLTGRDRWWTRPLRFVPLRYFGKLCFGLYLLHRPADTITTAIASRLDLDAGRISWIPIKIVVALGMASVSWFLLEKPILRLKSRFTSARHPSARPARASGLRPIGALASIVLLVSCTGTVPVMQGPDSGVTVDGARPASDARVVVDDDGGGIVDASIPVDASVVDPPPPQKALYPFGRRHSPITADVAARLQAAGIAGNAMVFAKIGDSITDMTEFATCFDGGNVNLGANGSLSGTLTYFRQGRIAGVTPFARDSLAAKGGWTSGDVLAGEPCPLERELAAATPRYGVILFGTNDNRYGRPVADFALDLWTAVDAQLAAGTVPIMSTLPPMNSYPEADVRVPLFNLVVRAIAQGRQVPLVDLYSELAGLPNDGISSDGLHPTVAPSGACDLTSGGLQYGYNVRNLVTLEALARARDAVNGTPSDASAPARQGEGTDAEPIVLTGLPAVDLGDTRDGSIVTACGMTMRGTIYELTLPSSRVVEIIAIGTAESIAIVSGNTCIAKATGLARATLPAGKTRIIVRGGLGEHLLVARAV